MQIVYGPLRNSNKEKKMSKNKLYGFLSILVIAMMILSACGPTPTEETGTDLAVGIVLPTKDEPRWLQDEARFQEALTAAGYDVEILFSQGDSAKEKANVEDLITKGAKVIILTPHDGAAAAARLRRPPRTGQTPRVVS